MTRAEANPALNYIVAQEYGAAVNRFLGKDVRQHVSGGTTAPVCNLECDSLPWKWAADDKRGDCAEATELLRFTGTATGAEVLEGIVKRRAQEADLIHLGDYTTGANPVNAIADGMLIFDGREPALKAAEVICLHHLSLLRQLPSCDDPHQVRSIAGAQLLH